MGRLARFAKARWISLLVLLGMAGAWQLLSAVYRAEAVPGEPMVPGWQVLATKTFLSLSDYWQGGFGVLGVAGGGASTFKTRTA